jgi:hypothetical protein
MGIVQGARCKPLHLTLRQKATPAASPSVSSQVLLKLPEHLLEH